MATAHAAHDDHHADPSGWRRYVYSTNHKDIGTMYLVFAIVAGVVGGILSIGMRLELQQPGMQIFASAHTFNVAQLDVRRWWKKGGDARRMVLEYNKYLAILVRESLLRLGGRPKEPPPPLAEQKAS